MTKTNRADSSKPASQSQIPVKFCSGNPEDAKLAKALLGSREEISSGKRVLAVGEIAAERALQRPALRDDQKNEIERARAIFKSAMADIIGSGILGGDELCSKQSAIAAIESAMVIASEASLRAETLRTELQIHYGKQTGQKNKQIAQDRRAAWEPPAKEIFKNLDPHSELSQADLAAEAIGPLKDRLKNDRIKIKPPGENALITLISGMRKSGELPQKT
jgi:hypothetical protein